MCHKVQFYMYTFITQYMISHNDTVDSILISDNLYYISKMKHVLIHYQLRIRPSVNRLEMMKNVPSVVL